jgi:hypothetical protein
LQGLHGESRFARSQHAIVLRHSLAKFGHCLEAQPLFSDRDGDSKLEMSDGCSHRSFQVETTHAYVARMRRHWCCDNRLGWPQVLKIVRQRDG